MSDWTDGYVTDLPYTPGYYRELSPFHLSTLLTLRGKHGPDIRKPLNYCELGMGYGVSLLAHAAALPHMQFWGFDFNPAHIVSASHIATECGLSNVTLSDASFEHLADQKLPKMDFICLHGVLSWISAENRKHIVEFINDRLNPGGVVYLSYNALPGWAAAQPLRELMMLHAERANAAGVPVADRVRNAMTFAASCVAHPEARHFKSVGGMDARIKKMQESGVNYLAHEYFNADWEAFYAHDVAELLSHARLEFVSSANYLEMIDVALLPAEALKFIAAQTDPMMKETLRDYFMNTQFRRDVYVRGAHAPSATQQTQNLMDMTWALVVPADQVKWKVQGLNGEITLREDVHEPMIRLLATGPKTAAQLLPVVPGVTLTAVLQALVLMAGGGYVVPYLEPDSTAEESAARYNRHVALTVSDTGPAYLVSPRAGIALPRGQVSLFFLAAMAQGAKTAEELASAAWKQLARRGQFLRHEGQQLKTAEENITQLTQIAGRFLEAEANKMREFHPL